MLFRENKKAGESYKLSPELVAEHLTQRRISPIPPLKLHPQKLWEFHRSCD